jgi:hypothetical protein
MPRYTKKAASLIGYGLGRMEMRGLEPLTSSLQSSPQGIGAFGLRPGSRINTEVL